VRPEAANAIISQLLKIEFNESRQRYMDKFVQVLKEWQRVNRSAAILDKDTVEKIAQSTEMQSFDPSISH
jgi:hypothetical protein